MDEVYLTDHTFDMKVKVLDQTDDSIEFRIPPFVKPGRLQLVVKTAGKEPLLLEQPRLYHRGRAEGNARGHGDRSASGQSASRQRHALTVRLLLLLLLLLLMMRGQIVVQFHLRATPSDQSSTPKSGSSGGASDGATCTDTSNWLSADPLNTPLVGGTSA